MHLIHASWHILADVQRDITKISANERSPKGFNLKWENKRMAIGKRNSDRAKKIAIGEKIAIGQKMAIGKFFKVVCLVLSQ